MFRHHPILFILSVILVPVLAGVVVLLIWYWSVRNEKLTIIDDQIYYEQGIFSKHRSQINISDIRNIRVYESLVNRIFGVGTLGISTAGQGNIEIEIAGVKDVIHLRNMINERRKQLQD